MREAAMKKMVFDKDGKLRDAQKWHPDPVHVPSADDMEDETFIKHLEKRHAVECKMEKTPVARHAVEAWLPSYRAFHERLHRLETPGQHDHVHDEWEDDEE